MSKNVKVGDKVKINCPKSCSHKFSFCKFNGSNGVVIRKFAYQSTVSVKIGKKVVDVFIGHIEIE